MSARTQYLASLVLTPLNLAWTTQLVGLVGLTAYIAPQRGLAVFALIPFVPAMRAILPIEQTLLLLAAVMAACGVIGVSGVASGMSLAYGLRRCRGGLRPDPRDADDAR